MNNPDSMSPRGPSKILRPNSTTDVAAEADRVQQSLKRMGDFEPSKCALEAAQQLPIALDRITSYLTNPRTLPFNLDVFVKLAWPELGAKDLQDQIELLISDNEEHLTPRYARSKAKAVEFYLKIYLLAENMVLTNQLQPAGVVEVGDGIFGLLFGQRRFMAVWVGQFSHLDCALYDIEALSSGYTELIQDSENDQREEPVFADYLLSKRTLYIKALALHEGNKSKIFSYMGVNRPLGYKLMELYERSDEEVIYEQVDAGKIASVTELKTWMDENPDGKKPKPKARPGSPTLGAKYGYPRPGVYSKDKVDPGLFLATSQAYLRSVNPTALSELEDQNDPAALLRLIVETYEKQS